jgi:putative oxidoreductase
MSNNVVVLIARILLSIIFILAGFQKFTDIAGTAGYIASANLPAATLLAWAAAAFETLGGIAILVGFQTKIASWLMAVFCVFTGLAFHYANAAADPTGTQMIMFMKNLAMAGGFLLLSVQGAGALSVDAKRG